MRLIFELRQLQDAHAETPLATFEEECHVDEIERRAKELLWTHALSDRQDLVIVRKAETGLEIYRRTIGTAFR